MRSLSANQGREIAQNRNIDPRDSVVKDLTASRLLKHRDRVTGLGAHVYGSQGMRYCRLHRTLNTDFPPPENNCMQKLSPAHAPECSFSPAAESPRSKFDANHITCQRVRKDRKAPVSGTFF